MESNDNNTCMLGNSWKYMMYKLILNIVCFVVRNWLHIALVSEKRLLYIGVHFNDCNNSCFQ